MDDFYWGAPFHKMVKVIDFVQKRGPDFGYYLNMDKSIYLMSPPSDQPLSEEQLEDRISQLEEVGIPRSNIKIHPACTSSCSSSLAAAREEQFGLKVLGAFVGSSTYVQVNVGSKIPMFCHMADVLIRYPYQQGRFLLHSFSFNSRVNYFLRTQFPVHSKLLITIYYRIIHTHALRATPDVRFFTM